MEGYRQRGSRAAGRDELEGGNTADAQLRPLTSAVRGRASRAFGCGIVLAAVLWTAAAAADEAAISFYPADAARGKTLAAVCIACHEPTGSPPAGQPFHTPRLGGQRPDSIFDALLAYRGGARHSDLMAPFAGALSLRDMRDVSAYLAGPQIKPSAAKVPDSTARERIHADCAACHGETGLGIMPGYPIVGGQYADYLMHALQAYRSGERTNPTMAVIARGLSEPEMRELARFFEARGYLRSDD